MSKVSEERIPKRQAPPGKAKVLAICFNTKTGDIAGNVDRAAAMIRRLFEDQPADLVVLPELFTCGYFTLDYRSCEEDTDSRTFQVFGALAEEIDAIIGWGFIRKGDGGKTYNSYALIEPGRPPMLVSKSHLNLAAPGDLGAETDFFIHGEEMGLFDTRIGRLGVMICADGVYPEVPRCMVLDGAQLILWPARSNGSQANVGVIRVRALDIVAPIVHTDGAQEGPPHYGVWSQIVDHTGKILAECRNPDGAMVAEVDLAAAARARATGYFWQAVHRARRPELYGALTRPNPYKQ